VSGIINSVDIRSKRFSRWCIILCGDGFMDFIHRPKCKILKIVKNQNDNVSEAGCASVLRRIEGEKRRTPILLGPLDTGPVVEASSV
jgi:hypothetical protein